MSNDRKPKIRKRRTRGVVGGTTQSGFASRSMSEILKQQQSSGSQQQDAPAGSKKKPEER